jgi:hypothetical protein
VIQSTEGLPESAEWSAFRPLLVVDEGVLHLYGHLFSDQLDDVADALDAAARAADVYPVCTRAEILPFVARS